MRRFIDIVNEGRAELPYDLALRLQRHLYDAEKIAYDANRTGALEGVAEVLDHIHSALEAIKTIADREEKAEKDRRDGYEREDRRLNPDLYDDEDRRANPHLWSD